MDQATASMAAVTLGGGDEAERRRALKEGVQEVFTRFCGGQEMDGKTFAKVCKDCKLLDKQFTSIDVDIIFAKIKDKAERKISLAQFRAGVDEIAAKKGVDRAALAAQMHSEGGNGPKRENVTVGVAPKLHDDPLDKPVLADAQTGSFKQRKAQLTATNSFKLTREPSSGSQPGLERADSFRRAGSGSFKLQPVPKSIGAMKDTFMMYAPTGEMGDMAFAKVCKDSGVLDRGMTLTDVDILFARVKETEKKKISYDRFEAAFEEISERKSIPFVDICAMVNRNGGPKYEGTEAEDVRFHDDRTPGGKKLSPVAANSKTSSLRNVGKALHLAQSIHKLGTSPEGGRGRPKRLVSAALRETFSHFASHEGMDNKAFVKVAKDARLIDKQLTTTDVDLIFAKIKIERKITVGQFANGLGEIADRKGVPYEQVVDAVVSTGGPVYTGTKTDPVRWHDDKSSYTGMHADGDVLRSNSKRNLIASNSQKRLQAGAAAEKDDKPTPFMPGTIKALRKVFDGYCPTGEMDGKTFVKVAKDSDLLDKALTVTDCDLVFSRIKNIDARRITFEQFAEGIEVWANKKGRGSANKIVEAIIETGGPQFQGTKADFVKFHDDKNMYTGMHADDEAKRELFRSQGSLRMLPSQKILPPVDDSPELQDHYLAYALQGEVDGFTYNKMMKDAELLDRNLTTNDVDIIFAKVKSSKEARKIAYPQFIESIGLLSGKKKVPASDIVKRLVASGGPKYSGTTAEPNKFHDDRSLYTGMYAANDHNGESPAHKPSNPQVLISNPPADSLKEVFMRFTPSGEMDGKTFAKVAKDCRLLDKHLSTIDMDIIFAKIKDKSMRKINFQQFEDGVNEIAMKKGVTYPEMSAKLKQSGGPKLLGTAQDDVRFYDDRVE